MKKDIDISGITCHFKSSAAIPRIYRLKFRRDIFVDMAKIQKMIKVQQRLKEDQAADMQSDAQEMEESEIGSSLPMEALELFENIAYLMHKHGDHSQPDDINEWLDQFDIFDIYKIFPEILTMWNIETQQMSQAKKKSVG